MANDTSQFGSTLVRRNLVAGMIAASIAGVTGASAQTVNPTTLEFTASPDHNAVSTSGTPLLSRYDLQYFLPGASQPYQTQSLGKPTPGGAGDIRIPVSSLSSVPSQGIVTEARVVSVGPFGQAPSDPSNQFMFADEVPPCSYSLAPATQNVGASGGIVSIAVNAGNGCTWSATSSSGWLSINAGSGSGNGQVRATAAANTTSSSRTATVTVNGQVATVTQSGTTGGGCTVDVSPTSLTLAAGGDGGSLVVTSGPGCTWSATSNANWLSITAATGSGSGWVSYVATPNSTGSSRNASISIGSRSVSVTQSSSGGGGGGGGCTVDVSPASLLLAAAAGSGSLSVASASSCTWTPTSAASWLRITAATGAGSGWVSYVFDANTASAARTTTVSVGGRTVDVMQSGTSGGGTGCSVDVSPTSAIVGSSASTGALTVTGASSCSWSTSSSASWLVITAATGSGSGWVSYSVESNPSTTSRTARVTVGNRFVDVTQNGSGGGGGGGTCTITVSPGSVLVGPDGSVDSLTVSSAPGCTWTATSSANWITMTAQTGGGSGWASYWIAPNPSTSQRTGSINVNGRSIQVTQSGR